MSKNITKKKKFITGFHILGEIYTQDTSTFTSP